MDATTPQYPNYTQSQLTVISQFLTYVLTEDEYFQAQPPEAQQSMKPLIHAQWSGCVMKDGEHSTLLVGEKQFLMPKAGRIEGRSDHYEIVPIIVGDEYVLITEGDRQGVGVLVRSCLDEPQNTPWKLEVWTRA